MMSRSSPGSPSSANPGARRVLFASAALPRPPAPPAAEPDKPESKQFRVKAQAQPVRQKPQPKPAYRLRNNRRPVSQLLQDQIDRLDEQNKS